VSKTRRPYPPEFRAEAVGLLRSSGLPIPEVARELGVSPQSLRNWLGQAQVDSGEREGLTSDEREELRRVRRENARVREEREILKKAATSSRGRPISSDELPADRGGEGTAPRLPAVQRPRRHPRRLLRLAAAWAVAAGCRRC
jgi:transposase